MNNKTKFILGSAGGLAVWVGVVVSTTLVFSLIWRCPMVRIYRVPKTMSNTEMAVLARQLSQEHSAVWPIVRRAK